MQAENLCFHCFQQGTFHAILLRCSALSAILGPSALKWANQCWRAAAIFVCHLVSQSLLVREPRSTGAPCQKVQGEAVQANRTLNALSPAWKNPVHDDTVKLHPLDLHIVRNLKLLPAFQELVSSCGRENVPLLGKREKQCLPHWAIESHSSQCRIVMLGLVGNKVGIAEMFHRPIIHLQKPRGLETLWTKSKDTEKIDLDSVHSQGIKGGFLELHFSSITFL